MSPTVIQDPVSLRKLYPPVSPTGRPDDDAFQGTEAYPPGTLSDQSCLETSGTIRAPSRSAEDIPSRSGTFSRAKKEETQKLRELPGIPNHPGPLIFNARLNP